MLCLSRALSYVHEPFNPGIWPRWTATPLPHRNLYVCPEHEEPYLAAMQAMVERRLPWRAQVGEIRTPGDAGRLLKHTAAATASRTRGTPTLIKDPLAVFSAEWLADRLDLEVVVMVRGPLAFASSIKRLDWAFDFGNWTRQPLLMRDVLGELDDEVRRAAAEPLEIIDQAILTWNATYAHLDRMRRANPSWHVVAYEQLASSPEAGFRALYDALGLRFDQRARQGIARHTGRGNAAEVAAHDKGGIRRDSRAAVDTWRGRLTDEEIERVTARTQAVADRLGVAATGAW